MQTVTVRIKMNKEDIIKGIYAFAFVGLHLGIRFEFGTGQPKALYSEIYETVDNSLIFIPLDLALIKGKVAPHWNHVDDNLVLSSESGARSSLYHKENNKVIFDFDIIGAIFFLLSRSEEFYAQSMDHHGRFPHKDSILYKGGNIRTPIIDHYLEVLKDAFGDAGIKSDDRRYPTAILSHDVDQPMRSIKGSIKLLFVSENPLASRLKGLRDSVVSRIKGRPNPFWNFDLYADAENQHGFKSVFYFTNPFKRTELDPKYNLAKENFKKVIRQLIEDGFEVGLHGSYNALSGEDDVKVEKRSFEEKVGFKIGGYRGHYLRLNVKDGFSRLNNAGFVYDSTMGYSSAIGYRCGTGLPFFTFDTNGNRVLPLIEIPFAVMDGPLFENWEYENIRGMIEDMISETISIQGTICVLWHLRTAYSIDYPEWFRVYQIVLELLAQHKVRVVTAELLANELTQRAKDWGYYEKLFNS
ncbi:MAG: hypothetical protein CO189_02030 [candidate division Zixibacteria bacterium CG_4_9_14_3_um_filter_46_8]|nr:MAG: hypothetical protein CO189_02030 [candidate division Zixibacteria bacterium CG_4_9_14_3_um_filter_46_8]